MALLNSAPIKLGMPAPDFSLCGVDGSLYSLASFKLKPILLILFICNHCPYVQAVEDRFITLRRDYEGRGVQLIGICSNDPRGYPEDSEESLRKRWLEKDYGFPYLLDNTQDVARAFGAVCTPDIFVYDMNRLLVYHGRIDDNWQNPSKVRRHDLREALDQLLQDLPTSPQQHPSMGCSIKWR